ncbi:MAG: hypothetical protein HC794_08770, partial [Nitrospiraceae bacterium]|nr:hypothetical protein [Nitrospiraceae bacterium]
MKYDLLIKNVRIVRPNANLVDEGDIAIKNGRFAKVAPVIPAESAAEVFDGKNRLAAEVQDGRVVRFAPEWISPFMYMERSQFPSEEEQFRMYRRVVEQFAGDQNLIGVRSRLLNATQGPGDRCTTCSTAMAPTAARSKNAPLACWCRWRRGTRRSTRSTACATAACSFVPEGAEVYEGMVVGEHCKDNDLVVNVVRE